MAGNTEKSPANPEDELKDFPGLEWARRSHRPNGEVWTEIFCGLGPSKRPRQFDHLLFLKKAAPSK